MDKKDGRANNGGHKNAGRKPKVDEEKVNSLFVRALKELYKKDTDDDAKVHFIKEVLLESQRGQIFVGEHVFGKAPQEVKQTTLNINEDDLTEEERQKIINSLKNSY